MAIRARRPRNRPSSLRRRGPLRLPLRAARAPGAAAEVPGIGAGDRVVPRQPARADGGLLPALRRPLPAAEGPRLPAVPHGRPRRVAVLLAVAAGCLDVAAR